MNSFYQILDFEIYHISMGKEKLETERQLPPLDWFVGLGYQDRGIRAIHYSDNFTGLADGEVGKYLEQWRKYYEREPVQNRRSKKRKEIAAKAILDAETFIRETTGFSMKEISAMKSKLLDEYRGKMEAPFAIELY